MSNMPIRIMTKDFQLLEEITRYSSLQLVRSWTGIGSIELRINRYLKGADKLQRGHIIFPHAHLGKAYQIRHREIELDENGKATENWIIHALALKSWFSDRLTIPPAGQSQDSIKADAETVMYHYADTQAIHPVNPSDALPVIAGISQQRGDVVDWQTRYKDFAEEMTAISQLSGLGWNIGIDYEADAFRFDVLQGRDLTAGQSVNPPAIFSTEFGTLKSLSYVESDLDYKNVAVVAGQGEGADRRVITVGDLDATGLDRRVLFVDARDIAEETEDEEPKPRPEADIIRDLENRGLQKLAEHQQEVFLEGQVLMGRTVEKVPKKVEGSFEDVRLDETEPPLPVLDGNILWYDFRGQKNTQPNRNIAKDLSENANDGNLQNFDFIPGSGYENGGLMFDGVDDKIVVETVPAIEDIMSFHLDVDVSKIKGDGYGGGVITLLKSKYGNRFNIGVKPTGFHIGFYNPSVSWNGKRIPFGDVTTNISLNFKINAMDALNNIIDYTVQIFVDGKLYSNSFDRGIYKYSNVARYLYLGWQATDASLPAEAYLKDVMTSVKYYSRNLTESEVFLNHEYEQKRNKTPDQLAVLPGTLWYHKEKTIPLQSIRMSKLGRYQSSRFTFTTDTPAGTSAALEYSLDNQTWHPLRSGDSLPFQEGNWLTDTTMYLRQRLTTTDQSVTPVIRGFTYEIHGYTEREFISTARLVYGKDYDLGDMVTLQNKEWGVTLDARITEVKEIYEPGNTGIELTFGNDRPTLISKIKQELAGVRNEIVR